MEKIPQRKTVLITGANGFISNAAANAFVAAGYETYGLVPRQDAVASLAAAEVIPVLGTPHDLSSLPGLQNQCPAFDVIVSNTEDLLNYKPHCDNVLSVILAVAQTSNQKGVRPFLIFASGCKDYGQGDVHSAAAKAFTEESPLLPLDVLVVRATQAPRATLSLTVFDHADLLDAAVVRPTTLYGGSSSYYGAAFEVAAKAAKAAPGQRILRIAAEPASVMHGTHVADVATAYLALAEAPNQIVAGQCFNISSSQYETAKMVATALVREYGLDGVEFVPVAGDEDVGRARFDVVGLLFGFSQCVGSEKLRRLVGWTDKRMQFVEGLSIYRAASEAAAQNNNSNVQRTCSLIRLWETGSM